MPSDEQAIRDVFHAWQRATLANDREAMRRLMADDVLFLTVGRPPLRGPDAFVDLMPDQPPDHIDFDQQILEISIHGDWAYAICLMNVAVTSRPGMESRRPRAGGPGTQSPARGRAGLACRRSFPR